MALGTLEAEGDVEWGDQNSRSKDVDTLLRLPSGCSSLCEHQGLGGLVDGGEELRDLLCLWVTLMAGVEGLQILLGLGKVSCFGVDPSALDQCLAKVGLESEDSGEVGQGLVAASEGQVSGGSLEV